MPGTRSCRHSHLRPVPPQPGRRPANSWRCPAAIKQIGGLGRRTQETSSTPTHPPTPEKKKTNKPIFLDTYSYKYTYIYIYIYNSMCVPPPPPKKKKKAPLELEILAVRPVVYGLQIWLCTPLNLVAVLLLLSFFSVGGGGSSSVAFSKGKGSWQRAAHPSQRDEQFRGARVLPAGKSRF